MSSTLRRGFGEDEFRARVAKAQSLMGQAGIDALLLTTHPDIYYFTGFLTRFWESPTRPWFVVVPQSGEPVAVIPAIGQPLMATTWVRDIRTWPAPIPDDDGVTLLADTLHEVIGTGQVGIPDGHESHVRMPLVDFERLKSLLSSMTIVGDSGVVRALRLIKSQAEVEKISQACAIAGAAFARVCEIARVGAPIDAVFRQFQMLCLEEGADWVPYLAGGAGPEGYPDVISPASSRPLDDGDVLMLDTGLVWDGYFCDFDRNFAIGQPSDAAVDAGAKLKEATVAGFEAARPGVQASDLFAAMDNVLTGGVALADNGRLGHGLGIQLTEWPSLIPSDVTVLQPGMVLTLEPGIATQDGAMLVHEENIVVTDSGARYLSNPARDVITRI